MNIASCVPRIRIFGCAQRDGAFVFSSDIDHWALRKQENGRTAYVCSDKER